MNATLPHPGMLATLKSFPAAVWFLFLGTFLNKFGSFVMPFLAFYMRERGMGLQAAGFVIGAYGAGNLIAAGIGGHLADTLGRRKTIVLSMLMAAVAMLCLSQASSFISLFFLTFLAGAASEFYRPAASALLIDLVPESQRATAFAAYRVALNAGWAAGPAVAGFLAKVSYLLLFVGDAVTSLLYAVVAWFFLPKGVMVSSAATGWRDAWTALKRDRVLQVFLIAIVAPAMLFFQMHSSLSAYVKDAGYSTEFYGFLLSLNGMLIILFELPITAVCQRFDPRRVMALGFALIGLGFALHGVGTAAWMLFFATAVFTLGEMIAMPITGSFVSKLAPDHMRGRYMGVTGIAWSTALFIGPVIGLGAYEHSPLSLWIGSLVLGLVSAAVILYRPASTVKTIAPAITES